MLRKWFREEVLHNPVRTFLMIMGGAVVILVPVSLGWEWISGKVMPNTSFGLYDRSFWVGLLVNLHGSVLELGVFGFLILWADSKRSISQEVKRFREDLSDYSFLDFDEVNLKKVGSIKRLNELGVYDIDVQNLCVNRSSLKGLVFESTRMIGLKAEGARIQNVVFRDVKMRSSRFSGSRISGSSFEGCHLYKTSFTPLDDKEAELRGVSFKGSVLERSDFTRAGLQNVNFNDCDLREVVFKGANLKQASLKRASNLQVERLAEAECLDYVKLDKDVLEKLLELRDDFKYQGAGHEGIEPSDYRRNCQ
ncbi:pentapeptide repeat-containing protein [Halomonas borealis]|uniref:pentapeptide repeat-containing protein n=1 Tax=Halomonas borealis TaxID=2508710 RepID=UPI00109EE335|nr:pentapeptide repeat-containing protein [Halomonas borealis]